MKGAFGGTPCVPLSRRLISIVDEKRDATYSHVNQKHDHGWLPHNANHHEQDQKDSECEWRRYAALYGLFTGFVPASHCPERFNVLRPPLALRPEFDLERQRLTDLRSHRPKSKGRDMNEYIFATFQRCQEPEASFVIPAL